MAKAKKESVPEAHEEHEHGHDHNQEMYEYQVLMQQYQQLQQHTSTIQKHIEELRRLESNIEDLGNLDKENTLIPLGSGIFVKGKLDEKGFVYMNVGSGVVVKKTTQACLDTIKKQLVEVEGVAVQIEQQMREIGTKIQELQEHLQLHNH